MKYFLVIECLIVSILIATLTSCSDSGTSNMSETSRKKFWEEINWKTADDGQYENFSINGLTPSCACGPNVLSCDFRFFSRKGSVNKLVIYFQGGGACWHYNSCIVNTNYNNQMRFFEQTAYLDLMSNADPFAQSFRLGGIFDFTTDQNPFKDWNFVYIPYCTGDLHTGANDETYSGNYTGKPSTGTIRHRGNVNFRVILEWLKNHYTTDPDVIFVTGISGGAYGSIFNFPYIRETFQNSQMFQLSDSGDGVLTEDFQTNGLPHWKMQIPNASTLPAGSTFTGFSSTLDLPEIFSTNANFYTDSTFAEFGTAWDSTQAYYYNVMQHVADDPKTWESSDPLNPAYKGVWCDWHKKQHDNIIATETAVAGTNYQYFVAPGSAHTILMDIDFYAKSSNEVLLVDWIQGMLDGDTGIFKNVAYDGVYDYMDLESSGKPDACPVCSY